MKSGLDLWVRLLKRAWFLRTRDSADSVVFFLSYSVNWLHNFVLIKFVI